ncbi:P-loop containing nucleoside triphosphate hydrolase protein [Thamnocephalis sphaerospora]|uniref:P-loop containing nucleoside triphosphate hydrolase protein n=1 Tax=Thamnocephalis sphaerospora TaxID=78915 RepID=A0A4V1IWZ2_9FUNG|nr:P-loop containing nucleoside triphosphate hydrolase protein [Thamnocephalis sphaerospora]|eukprot:RKP09249.1 P-loop containing nucleoside triphosphate hydrolase protein [Thamnocephalis sphaerospora]
MSADNSHSTSGRHVFVTEEYTEMSEATHTGGVTFDDAATQVNTESSGSSAEIAHEEVQRTTDLKKTATALSTGSAMLTEDQVVARKAAEAREKARQREERRKQHEEQLKKRGFFARFRKHPKFEDEEEVKKEPDEKVSMLQLFRFATATDKLLIVLAAICSLLLGVAIPVMTIIFSSLLAAFTDYGTAQGLAAIGKPVDMNAARDHFDDEVKKFVIYFVILGVVTFVVAYGQQSLWMVSGENQTSRMRHDYFSAIIRQEIAWFDATSTGDLTSRITSDVNLVQEGTSEKVGMVIQSVCTFLAGFIIAFTKGWKMALVLLCVFPVLATAGAIMGHVVSKAVRGGQNAYAKAGAVAEEVIAGIKTVSAFGGQEREVLRYESKLDMALKEGKSKSLGLGLSVGTMLGVLFCAYGLGFWYGSRLILDREMDIQGVLNVFFALIIGTMTIGMAATPLSSIQTAQGAAYKIFAVIDRQSQIDYNDESGLRPEITGQLEVRGVNFAYPSRPDVQVLYDFDLDVEPGQTVALVGSSGSGKSTMVALLERFYNPLSGSIKLNGTPIQDINLRYLRQHIGLVGQEPVLFQASIKQNILWGSSGLDPERQPTQEDVEAACRSANVHDFIMTLPEGYDTLVGEKGALLSGGQKQRIAIARALVRNPRILLLDEATSALDTESEKLVQEALDRAAEGRTTITIAHRLSTIRDADKIVVMSRGKIIEVGKHDELIARGGLYSKLVQAQQLRMEKDRDMAQEAKLLGEADDEDDVSDEVALDVDQPLGKPLGYTKTKDTVMSELEVKEAQERQREEYSKKPTPFMRVVRMNMPELKFILPALAGSVIDGAIMPVFSVIFTKVINSLSTFESDPEKMKSDSNFWSLMFVVLGIITFFAVACRIGLFVYSGERLVHRIRKVTFAAILRQEMGFFDDQLNNTGVLCAKLSTEAEMVNGIAGRLIGTFVQMGSTLLTGLIIAFVYGWKLTLVVLACVPVLGLANMLNVRMQLNLNKKTKSAYEHSAHIACEAVENMRTVVSLGREDTFRELYSSAIEGPHAMSVRTAFVSAVTFAASQCLLFFIYSVALYYGSRLVLDGEYDVQKMMQVMFAVIFSAMAVSQTSGFAPDIAKARIAAVEIFELLDRVSAIDPTNQEGKTVSNFTGEVKARDVRFRYPARKDVKVLRGLNLDVTPGKTIALVGSSGCGKSTMIGLIERFYDAESGDVTVDGVSVKDWKLPALRSEISLVGQEPVLFDLTIGENIAYSKPGATEEEIHQAARDANIYDFVISLPDGFDTPVGERGTQLSGGQKQRIAIARAILRNPRLLLLDEATSALDTESEKIVQEALDRASEGRTTITIAHRLSTIQDADIIYVFKDGRILESGKHNELIRNKGLYYALVQKQSLERKDE